jgi:hypothetical protein
MANKIGKVLEIKPEDSYIKRPVDPMITVETRDIGKFAKYIRIPSMAKRSTKKNTTLQKILYSGPQINAENAANLGISPEFTQWPKSPIWSGNIPISIPPTWNERVARALLIHPPPNPPPTPTEMGGNKGAGARNHQGKPNQLPKWKGIKQDRKHPPKLKKTKKWGSCQPPQLNK